MSEAKTFQGAPCKRGHSGLRYISGSYCVDCAKANARKWADENPDKRREVFAAFVVRHGERVREATRARGAAWRAANKGRVAAKSRRWRQEKPWMHCVNQNRRRANKLRATPTWLSDDDRWLIEQFYEMAALRSQMTGVEHHVDHIVPLQGKTVRGLHVPWNLQILPARENIRKGNRLAA